MLSGQLQEIKNFFTNKDNFVIEINVGKVVDEKKFIDSHLSILDSAIGFLEEKGYMPQSYTPYIERLQKVMEMSKGFDAKIIVTVRKRITI